MKKILTGLLVVFTALTVLVSCDKEFSLETGGGLVVPQGSFRAQIDGEQWIATQVKSASRLNGVILLVGASGDGQSITLRVVDSGVHNYQLQNTSDNKGFYMDSSIVPISEFGTDQWLVDSTYGNINITAIDTVRKTISGNFQMKVFRQIDGLKRTITNGEFTNISYGPPPVVTPPPGGADTFRVKVGGVDFNYSTFSGAESFGIINMTAMSASGQTVMLTLPAAIAVGTHNFSAGMPMANYMPDMTTMMEAVSGSVEIIEHNVAGRMIRGNFSFEANDPDTPLPNNVVLSDGYFSITY